MTRAASRLKLLQLEAEQAEPEAAADGGAAQPVNTLIPIANPLTANELVSLALLMRPEWKECGQLYALHVRNDNSASSRPFRATRSMWPARWPPSVESTIVPIERYDLNFVTGMINVIEERDISQVIIGLHRRTQFIDSFFGDKLSQLLKATNRMVVIVRLFMPRPP